ATSTMSFVLIGAILAVVIVLALGGRSSARGIVPLILAGAVISAVLYAYINAMVLLNPTVFDSYRFWMVGSLAGVELAQLGQVAVPLLAGLVLALVIGQSLNALALGDETAISPGIRVGQTRLIGIIEAALLGAAATAIARPMSLLQTALPTNLDPTFDD